MSTNKTQNYQLHGWAPEDEFPRSELNANFTKLDTALKAEEAARAAAVTGEVNTRVSAINALYTALAGKIGIVTGSYMGQRISSEVATPSRRIELGFRPKLVLVANANRLSYGAVAAINDPPGTADWLVIDNTGFIINNGNFTVDLKNNCYIYMAFY